MTTVSHQSIDADYRAGQHRLGEWLKAESKALAQKYKDSKSALVNEAHRQHADLNDQLGVMTPGFVLDAYADAKYFESEENGPAVGDPIDFLAQRGFVVVRKGDQR